MEAFAYANAPAARDGSDDARVRLNELERAIYSTIAYRDVLDFAPTLAEIHRYLHLVRCKSTDIARALGQQPLSSHIISDVQFYALRDRAHLLALRPERQNMVKRF